MADEIKRLITEARRALKDTYAPYSKHRFGAALLSQSGRLFTGCNIENASYGLTVCAERVAIWKAVSGGERKFKIMALVTSTDDTPYPCGACRQVMHEFTPRLKLLLVDKYGKTVHQNLATLLPSPFVSNETSSEKISRCARSKPLSKETCLPNPSRFGTGRYGQGFKRKQKK